MTKKNFSMWSNLRYDAPASVVVALVALPLCLGVALASGAPAFSGIIAGIIGGIVVGFLSKSPLSVSGPAAGLTVIVLNAIGELPSFEGFLLAVCLAGVIQVALGMLRAGVIGDFIPSAVIKGMLAAIGLILILKQLPHAIGYDVDFEGNEGFAQTGNENTFTTLWHMFNNNILFGAVIISSLSLLFLFWWDKKQPQLTGWLRYVPGPLVVVFFGVAANLFFQKFAPSLAIGASHLVAVPVADSAADFLSQFSSPDFSLLGESKVWVVAITLALVASVETLLSIEAVDKLDSFKRVTPTNRELIVQGIGNIASGMIGGLPVTSVIVRSSANVTSGARTQMSTILHGILLLLCVVAIPSILNLVPFAALAAILIAVGYKLTKPAIFREKYEMGRAYFIPFVVTISAILLTDLLTGIAIGIAVGVFFIVLENYRSMMVFVVDNNNYLMRFKKDVFFIHKYELKKKLSSIPDGANVLLDFSRVGYIDLDNVGIINDFVNSASFKDIIITIKPDSEGNAPNLIKKTIVKEMTA